MVVWIVSNLHLLDVDGDTTTRLNAQKAISYSFWALSLHHKLSPFILLKGPLSTCAASIHWSSGEIDIKSNVLIGPSPERRRVFCQMIHIETFNNANIA